MIKRITFTGEDGQRFKFLWDGLRLGTLSTTLTPEARGPEVLRLEAATRRALKGISTNGATIEGDADQRTLMEGGGVVELEQPEIRLITDRGYLVGWRPEWVESWLDAVDWLDAAPVVGDNDR